MQQKGGTDTGESRCMSETIACRTALMALMHSKGASKNTSAIYWKLLKKLHKCRQVRFPRNQRIQLWATPWVSFSMCGALNVLRIERNLQILVLWEAKKSLREIVRRRHEKDTRYFSSVCFEQLFVMWVFLGWSPCLSVVAIGPVLFIWYLGIFGLSTSAANRFHLD